MTSIWSLITLKRVYEIANLENITLAQKTQTNDVRNMLVPKFFRQIVAANNYVLQNVTDHIWLVAAASVSNNARAAIGAGAITKDLAGATPPYGIGAPNTATGINFEASCTQGFPLGIIIPPNHSFRLGDYAWQAGDVNTYQGMYYEVNI